MFFKLFTQYRPRDHGANKVGSIVIPREVKKKRETQKIHKFGILSPIYTFNY